jgi:HK97 family phage major capsid protein
MELKDQLTALQGELKSYVDKAEQERKDYGAMSTKTTESITKLQSQVDAIDTKLATRHLQEPVTGSALKTAVTEDESMQRLLRNRKGHASFTLKGNAMVELMGYKTVISATGSGSDGEDTLNPVGVATTGVLQIQRTPGITPEARQVLKIRDVLSASPTTMAVVDFVKVSSPMSIGSPVPEASLKPENSLTFQSVSEKVRLIATWIPATRQVLDDMTELMSFIKTSLPYYINLEEELQLLAGDDTGENLHGLIPQAVSFNTGLLTPAQGWTRIDVIARAVQQINALKEIDPTFVILNTNDWWSLRLTKDSFGRYILGDPQIMSRPNIFGLDVVFTTSIAQGSFLVGSGSPIAAQIRDRMEMQVEISTENQDYFVRNLVAIRAEKRLALLTKRPNSFVSGTFTTSP